LGGIWAATNEPGWGVSIAHQSTNNRVFVVIYAYTNAGSQQWLVLPESAWSGDNTTVSGRAYETRGSRGLAAFQSRDATATATAVGQVTLVFTTEATLDLILAIPGAPAVKKSLTRFVF
jgi:hypothetical protein